MKNIKKSSRIMLFIAFISICCIPLISKAQFDPGDGGGGGYNLLPSSIHAHPGDTSSGNLESLYYYDFDVWKVKADQLFSLYFATMEIGFPNTKCYELKLSFDGTASGEHYDVNIYYTTGDRERYYSLHDGYYTFDLDDTRYLDYIEVIFDYCKWFGGNYYIMIDWCVAKPD